LRSVNIKEKYSIIKSQLKIGYKKTHNTLFVFFYIHKK